MIIPTLNLYLMKVLHSIIFISITVSLFACKNKVNPNPPPCEINPGSCKSILEAKDFFVFKIGSYWVYEEETTHQRDSLYVVDYANVTNDYDFDVRIKSSLTEYIYHYWPTYYGNITGCNVNGTVTNRCLYVNRSKYKFQDHLGETIIFYLNYNIGENISTGSDMDYCPDNHLSYAAKYDSIMVGNNFFHNVVRVDQECEFAEGKQPTRFYYSKNIGIIKKEFLDSNQVWNLVNHFVIQ